MKNIITLILACLVSSSVFAEAKGSCYQMQIRTSVEFSIVIQYRPCVNGAAVLKPGTQEVATVEKIIPKNSYAIIPVVQGSAIQYRDETNGSYSEHKFDPEVYVPAAKERNMDCSTFNRYSICYLYKQNGYESAWKTWQAKNCTGDVASGYNCQ